MELMEVYLRGPNIKKPNLEPNCNHHRYVNQSVKLSNAGSVGMKDSKVRYTILQRCTDEESVAIAKLDIFHSIWGGAPPNLYPIAA